MSRPTFSVVVPTWNDALRLPRALYSVLRQTSPDFELIVVDDGSTDATAQVVESIRDPRLRSVRQSHAGVSAARNRGLAEARGRWVIFLDSDDEALPPWLEALLPATREPEVGLISCGVRLVRSNCDRDGETLLPEGEALFHHLPALFLAGAFAVEKGLLDSVGGYTEALSYSENTDLGIRLSDRCVAEGRRVIPVLRTLIRYHLRPEARGQQSRNLCRRRLEAVRYFLENHQERLAGDPETLRSFFTLGGVLAARLGLASESRRLFRRGLALDPWGWRPAVRFAVSWMPGLARRIWPEPEGP